MMASLEMNNSITSLLTDLANAAEDLPELRRQILTAQADIVEPALRSAIPAEGLVDTGQLQASIGRSTRMKGHLILIGPSGERIPKVSRTGRVHKVRNGHLGYIYEYGLPGRGILPRKWMSKTVTRVKGAAFSAAETANDQYLKKHNL